VIERIAILGGSSVYIPEFILSVISHNLNVKEIVLQGTSERKLTLVSRFCQRLLDKSGFPATVIPLSDVGEAVAGARYILNHIRVGGLQARLRDEKLPIKHGMVGDETLGAGGFANAMRTLPVVLDYAAKIESVNPDAILINLTNPMGICVEALTAHTKLNVIGVCDLPGTYVKKVAKIVRKEPEDLQIDYIGLNHMGWIQDVRVSNRSIMSRVLEYIEKHRDDGFDSDLVEVFRMIPTRTMSLCFHQDAILRRQKTCSRFRAEALHEAEQQILELYEDEHLTEVPELTRARDAVWYEETIVPLIAALENKKEERIILCVRNEGAIRDLPENCSVEVPVKVSKKGMKPVKVGNCPRFLKGLFAAMKESDRLTVEAVRHKSKEYALQALTINPLVPSLDAAKQFLQMVMREEQLELH
jgi:6-phospho-beta-glucosidase